jgi:hypothetical protein
MAQKFPGTPAILLFTSIVLGIFFTIHKGLNNTVEKYEKEFNYI